MNKSDLAKLQVVAPIIVVDITLEDQSFRSEIHVKDCPHMKSLQRRIAREIEEGQRSGYASDAREYPDLQAAYSAELKSLALAEWKELNEQADEREAKHPEYASIYRRHTLEQVTMELLMKDLNVGIKVGDCVTKYTS